MLESASHCRAWSLKSLARPHAHREMAPQVSCWRLPKAGRGGVARPPWRSDGSPASVPAPGSACEPDMRHCFPEGHAGPGGSVPSAKANSQRHCPTGKMRHLSGALSLSAALTTWAHRQVPAAMIPLLPSTNQTSLLHRQVPRGPAEWRLLG